MASHPTSRLMMGAAVATMLLAGAAHAAPCRLGPDEQTCVPIKPPSSAKAATRRPDLRRTPACHKTSCEHRMLEPARPTSD